MSTNGIFGGAIVVILSFALLSMTPFVIAEANSGDNYWIDGSFATYDIRITTVTRAGPTTANGTISFQIEAQNIVIKLDLYGYLDDDIHKTITCNILDNKTYYNSENIILPFYYNKDSTDSILSEYNNTKEIITKVSNSIANLNEQGIMHGQPLTVIDAEITSSRINYTEHSSYTYGTNTGLLFSAYVVPYHTPLFGDLFGIIRADGSSNFHLTLTKTNIDLGPINLLAMFVGYIAIFFPLILVVVVVVLFAYIYHRSNKKRKKEVTDHFDRRKVE